LKFKTILILLLVPFALVSSELEKSANIRGLFSLTYKSNINFDISFTKNAYTNNGNSVRIRRDIKPFKKKKLLRALLINGSLWLADSIRYWATYAAWIEDWQFQLNWEDQSERFFTLKANRFDSNPFKTNWTHGLGGAIHYNTARYHGLTVIESLLFATTFSLAWEYLTEWREVISINDNFFSGIGGLPIGEPLYQLGKYLLGRKGTISHIAGYILNPVFALNDILGGKKWRSHFSEDYFSYPTFYLKISNENIDNNYSDGIRTNRFHFYAESEFKKIPGFGIPSVEETNLSLNSTFYSSIKFGISLGSIGIQEYTFDTKVIYLGYFHQRLNKNPAGLLKGYSFYIGASSAFGLFKKRALEYYDISEYHYDFTGGEEPVQPLNFTDKLAIINLIGPSTHISLYSSPFKLEITADAYFDFGLINSLALNKYSQNNNIFKTRMKTTLSYYGYYYAFGYTLNLNTKLKLGNIFFTGGAKYQKYGSIQGLDRFEDKVQDDSKIIDSRSIFSSSIGYKIPRTNLVISILFERRNRRGSLHDITVKASETRILSSIGFLFE